MINSFNNITSPSNINSFRVSLTNLCNYDCFFCHNEGLPKKKTDLPDDIFLKGISVLSELSEELGINRFSITGGEPMLSKIIFDVLDTIKTKNKNANISLSSNAFLLNEETILELSKYIYKVNINFQSIDDNNFQIITGRDGLKKIKENILLFQKYGIEVGVNMVFTTKNEEELEEMVNFIIEKGLSLKILELVRDKENLPYYSDIANAKEIIRSKFGTILGYENISGSEDKIYLENNANVRLISSYCNIFNGEACKQHGELRISNTLTLNHCLVSKFKAMNILEEIKNNQKNKIRGKLKKIENAIGLCPKC
ncbi:MAG: radical SAM protein [Candidatus Gracilibacteria bacterium]